MLPSQTDPFVAFSNAFIESDVLFSSCRIIFLYVNCVKLIKHSDLRCGITLECNRLVIHFAVVARLQIVPVGAYIEFCLLFSVSAYFSKIKRFFTSCSPVRLCCCWNQR
ncbi:uncharacterized protein DEA37_0004063 [Paragonimus westermani]|uniref:Uncharacterized protein n=1 Tax=Paragonimus westermani TaxID=34504 RepID=A0A5J4NDB5_9TREM|nr:uncharacterized protein DEA37_0004063 [Paragonimus westermani]